MIALIIVSPALIISQSSELTYTFLPKGLHLLPIKASFEEARVGVLYMTENANLKVDIGNSIDVLLLNFDDNKMISLGMDFMAYALATSYKGNRLQIDALDGFFGGNITYSVQLDNRKFYTRFRIIHNSAHLVDGHYDLQNNKWLNNDLPIPYTRDFGELTFVHEIKNQKIYYRYYGSISYSTLVRPVDLKKYSISSGIEAATDKIIGSVLQEPTNIFIAYHFSLEGIPEYVGNNHFMLGLKFGEWQGKGILLYLSQYNGYHFLSEYYNQRISRFSIGFFVDF